MSLYGLGWVDGLTLRLYTAGTHTGNLSIQDLSKKEGDQAQRLPTDICHLRRFP